MIYLFIDENQIKILYLKKTMLGQHETYFFEKKYETKLIDNNISINSDLAASAIKEALTLITPTSISEKDVYLILPQNSFYFLRTSVPSDIAPSAISSFIKDKARTILQENIEDYFCNYFIQENSNQKIISFYAIKSSLVDDYKKILALVDLKLFKLLPETIGYFKLFEKTLRKEKKENIFYVTYNDDKVSGYLYDTFGLTSPDLWKKKLCKELTIEKALKEKVADFESNGSKLNRVILSGNSSESIRQDTFTKAIGAWTNPLKRIIPNFYQDYLKILILNQNKKLPILNFDECFGTFIFNQENKDFNILKNNLNINAPKINFKLPRLNFNKKTIGLFLTSFICSFFVFWLLFKTNINTNLLTSINKPTPTLSPTSIPPSPTPTIIIDKETIKIKILNGSGTAGKASEMKTIFTDLGYQQILTGNADNFDYTNTIIQTKKNDLSNATVIKKDLKDYVTAKIENTLEDDNAADVIIIIGTDFK